MHKNEIAPPPVQQTFEFARNDMWDRLPEAARDECRRLIMQQLKVSLEFELHLEDHNHERKDSL